MAGALSTAGLGVDRVGGGVDATVNALASSASGDRSACNECVIVGDSLGVPIPRHCDAGVGIPLAAAVLTKSGGEVVVVVGTVNDCSECDLLDVAEVDRLLGGCLGLCEDREEDSGENGDNGDYDKQLDERECFLLNAGHAFSCVLLLTLLPVEELGTLVRKRADRLLCFQQSIAIIRGQCQIKVNQTLIES